MSNDLLAILYTLVSCEFCSSITYNIDFILNSFIIVEMYTVYKSPKCRWPNQIHKKYFIKKWLLFFQETDLLLIKCSHSDGKDTKVFQERAKLFGTKKVETIIGLQIQGPHAIKKCLAVRSIIKYKNNLVSD